MVSFIQTEVSFIQGCPLRGFHSILFTFSLNKYKVLSDCKRHCTTFLMLGSSGRFERTDIPPGDYTLRVVAKDPSTGERKVIRRSFRVSGDNTYCTVVLINRGVTVDGNSATVEFRGSGIVSQYACSVDRQEYMPCE